MSTVETEKDKANVSEATTCPAKYIFMDIVGFSRDRHLEAQSAIVSELNRIVLESVSKNGITDPKNCIIFIPTGDGICVSLIESESYDIHMRIALDILAMLDKHNQKTVDDVYKFQVRIGLNSNEDNLIQDINNRLNLAGAGITLAQRIMDKADASQILVGQSVYASLGQHKQYWKSFKEHQTEDKHGNKFFVYQYQGGGYAGLNTDTPLSLKPDDNGKRLDVAVKLSEDLRVAYYLALAIKNEQFLKSHQDKSDVGMVLLWILATDCVGKLQANDYQDYEPLAFKTDPSTFENQFQKYLGEHYSLRLSLASYIRIVELSKYEDCFVLGNNPTARLFISSEGKQRLKDECPRVWQEFGLDQLGQS